MNKIFTLVILCAWSLLTQAQTTAVNPTAQPFGKVEIADLQMKECDFEKDANAEVLFNKADVYFDPDYNIIIEVHKRIKIFNENGKGSADIRIEYYGGDRSESITRVQAQTINLNNGSPEITKVDKSQIFTEKVDKTRSALVFSFPNVKPGSIIEYKYTSTNHSIGNFPDWYFQAEIPTRYSELNTKTPDILFYKNLEVIHHPYIINKTKGDGTVVRAQANIPSVPKEPFMTCVSDNAERILFQLMTINQAGYRTINFSDSWKKVGETLLDFDDYGGQLNHKVNGEEALIAKAKTLKTDDEKIAYLFNEVRNQMKWNGYYTKYTNDGTSSAWDKKTGNSSEINMILYHLLKKLGIKVYPMIVSTRKNGRVNPAYPNYYQFNSSVAYVPVDSTRSYVLDASSKYNVYNQIPGNFLNSFGFYMNKEGSDYQTVFLNDPKQIRQVTIVSGEIKPDGKLNGTAVISDFAYKKLSAVEKYKTDGEKKYIDYLCDGDNNLKIKSIKLEDMDADSLPLKQRIDFDLDLTSSDDNYIYFNPNLLSSLKTNPFLSETRKSDIDFGYCNSYYLNGSYKLPAGYKVDALPKNVSMTMPDKSINFKRMMIEQDGNITVRYIIDLNKSIYFKEDYDYIHEFYKKMYEMLNEQIVLKKS